MTFAIHKEHKQSKVQNGIRKNVMKVARKEVIIRIRDPRTKFKILVIL